MNKLLTDYANDIMEVGDTLTDYLSRKDLSDAKGGYIYEVIYVGINGDYAARRILPSGKPSKRIIGGLWSRESHRYVPGGENPWK